jgi:hypothetical protein
MINTVYNIFEEIDNGNPNEKNISLEKYITLLNSAK